MKRIHNHIQKFKQWQTEPYPVAPMSEKQQVCKGCDTEFVGNYCPRCGQSIKVEEKMTLWKTFLLFIDVWGLGNRGMFHTLRDLIFRPGFLICDYLQGRRSAYFPPFKLLFLLTTLSLVVSSGFNIQHENFTVDYHISNFELQSLEDEVTTQIFGFWNYIVDLQDRFPAVFRLVLMTVTCVFYFLCFRKSKKIGTLNYHEFFIAMIYMVNMANIYSIIFRFFCLPDWLIALPTLLYIIPLRQLTGYTWINTISRFILTWMMITASIIILFFTTIFIFVGLNNP